MSLCEYSLRSYITIHEPHRISSCIEIESAMYYLTLFRITEQKICRMHSAKNTQCHAIHNEYMLCLHYTSSNLFSAVFSYF